MKNQEEDRHTARDRATTAFMQYSGYIRSVAWRAAPDRALVDDIVNDVFIYFVDNAERWDYSGSMLAFLKSITRNISREYWREHQKNLPENLQKIAGFLQRTMDKSLDPLEEIPLELQKQAITLCMDKLPSQHRLILIAFYFEKKKLTEISRERNIKPGTLQKMVCRIRAVLRECVLKTFEGGQLHVE